MKAFAAAVLLSETLAAAESAVVRVPLAGFRPDAPKGAVVPPT